MLRAGPTPLNAPLLLHPPTARSYTDDYSPVRLDALVRSKVSLDSLSESDLDYADSARGLATLRGRLKLAIANFQGCSGEYVNYVKKVGQGGAGQGGAGQGGGQGGAGRGEARLHSRAAHTPAAPHPAPCSTCNPHPSILQAIDLEAVCKSRQHGVLVPPSGHKGRWAEARWAYKCRVRPWVLRLVAGAAGAASAVLVWSEVTIGSGRSPDLSPFSLMVRDPEVLRSEFGGQVLVALPLIYMCACAYFSLLKLGSGVASFYHVVRGAARGGAGCGVGWG